MAAKRDGEGEVDGGATELVVRRSVTGRGQKQQVRKGWTKAKQAKFLAELAATSNVTHSVKVAGVSARQAYVLKSRDAGFAAQWAAALAEGYAELEMMLLHRARFGTVRTETMRDGDQVMKGRKTVHDYPMVTAMRLLLSHRESVTATRIQGAGQTAGHAGDQAAAVDAIMRRMAEVRARLGLKDDVADGVDGAGDGPEADGGGTSDGSGNGPDCA